MIKVIALLRKKPGMPRDAFIARYETFHAPLIRRLLPHIAEYRRNYVDRKGAFAPSPESIDFDSVTEMRFASRSDYDAFLAVASRPDIARQIAEDEEALFDRAATRMFVVDETAPLLGPGDRCIEELAAERAIREGLARFARVLDTKDWAALSDVFARDITFDYGLGEEAGLPALEANIRRFLDVCGPSQHLIGSITLSLEAATPGQPPRAVSRAYVQARHQRRNDPGGAVFDSNGEYVDRWEQFPEGWRIIRRDAIWQTQSGDSAIIWGS
jgi:hypothetical protein